MKIPPKVKTYLWLVLAAVVMGGLAAWLLAGMVFDKQFPPTVTLLGMAATAASLIWPGVASLFTDVSSDLAQLTATVSRSFAVAGPLLAAAGVILDDKLGWPGFWLSIALGAVFIPLLLATLLGAISNLRSDDTKPTAGSASEPDLHH